MQAAIVNYVTDKTQKYQYRQGITTLTLYRLAGKLVIIWWGRIYFKMCKAAAIHPPVTVRLDIEE